MKPLEAELKRVHAIYKMAYAANLDSEGEAFAIAAIRGGQSAVSLVSPLAARSRAPRGIAAVTDCAATLGLLPGRGMPGARLDHAPAPEAEPGQTAPDEAPDEDFTAKIVAELERRRGKRPT